MHGWALKTREFYEARAKSIIKDLRDQRQLSYRELAERLVAMGVRVDERILINRINRGSFSFAFALGSLPLVLTATMISFASLEKTLPFFLSEASFLCLILAHLLCPDIEYPFLYLFEGFRLHTLCLSAGHF